MSDGAITVDFSDVDNMLAQYVVLSRKTVSAAIAHHLGNWCFEAQNLVKRAQKEMIGKARNEFKLISWLLTHNSDGSQKEKVMFSKETVNWKSGKNKSGEATMREMRDVETFGATKSYMDKKGNIRLRKTGFRSVKTQRAQGRMQYFSRAYAKDFALRHMNKRKNAAFFSSMFLLKMAIRAGSGQGARQEKSGSGISVENQIEDADSLLKSAIVSRYRFHLPRTYALQDNQRSADHAEQVSMAALQSTVDGILPNMEQYIARKMDEIQHGGRAA